MEVDWFGLPKGRLSRLSHLTESSGAEIEGEALMNATVSGSCASEPARLAGSGSEPMSRGCRDYGLLSLAKFFDYMSHQSLAAHCCS
jgi:hypothetical protein